MQTNLLFGKLDAFGNLTLRLESESRRLICSVWPNETLPPQSGRVNDMYMFIFIRFK